MSRVLYFCRCRNWGTLLSIHLTTNLDLSRLSSPGPGMEVCLFTLPPPVTLLLSWLPSPSGSSSSIVPSNTSLRNLEVININNMEATISFPNVTLEKLWMTLGTYFPPVSWRRLCKCEGVNDGQCLCVVCIYFSGPKVRTILMVVFFTAFSLPPLASVAATPNILRSSALLSST